jgi:hypothetical protein
MAVPLLLGEVLTPFSIIRFKKKKKKKKDKSEHTKP